MTSYPLMDPTNWHSAKFPRRTGHTDHLPLSFAQQRLWLIDQMQPRNPAYNISVAIGLNGLLDVTAMQWSLGEIIRRHESLRTTFAARADGDPVQVVHADFAFCMEQIDLSGRPEEALEMALRLVRLPFDLRQGPLLRATLLRTGAAEQMLVLAMHQIVADTWSVGALMKEMAVLYSTRTTGEAPVLAALPVQYGDYAIWQRQRLHDKVLQQQGAYWREWISGLPAVELPSDRPRPAVQTPNGALRRMTLSTELSAALHALSQREGATLQDTLLAALQILIYRYTGQVDAPIGVSIPGRPHRDLEGLIGCFAHPVVMRGDLSGSPTFRQLLARTCQRVGDAYAHQDVPVECMLDLVQPERALSGSPLFQVALTMQNVPIPLMKMPNLTLELLVLDTGLARVDLELDLMETQKGIAGNLFYRTDLFDGETIERLIGHYAELLQSIVTHPDERIERLSILTAFEREQILLQWNATASSDLDASLTHLQVEQRAEETPDAIALIDGAERLSYGELNRQANRLARYLRRFGVSADGIVGLCIERSISWVVAMLGVLKAGGAYAALDPSYPPDRLAYMVRDCGAAVLLTRSALLSKLPETGTRTICLDADWSAIGMEDDAHVANAVTAQNLAYVIYTSGSTGRPKGVLIPHGGLSNMISWNRRQYRLTAADRGVQSVRMGFDAHAWELWPYLTAGTTVYLVPHDLLMEPERLRDWLVEQTITVALFLPVIAERLIFLRWPAHTALRVMQTGGDRLMLYPPAGLPFTYSNIYGPTESTVIVTTSQVEPVDRAGETDSGRLRSERAPHIGQPVPNVRVYVLDRQMNPVPVGVVGELYIGGIQLARGYLNRPDLTAERFLCDPFGEEPGERLYRTGDLVRYRRDGNIEFVGRADAQVKIRGFRIELGEIEAVLAQHAMVEQAFVTVWEPKGRPTYKGYRTALVAYITCTQGAQELVPTLQRYLADRLPDYMIPASFMIMDRLPLTPNGKVDRKALPMPRFSL